VLVVEVERLDGAASFQLVQAVADAVHRRAEGIAELPCVAVVVTVREQQVPGPAMLVEPADSLRRDHRVDQDALERQVVGADLAADALAEGLPVPETGRDLLHEPSLARPPRS